MVSDILGTEVRMYSESVPRDRGGVPESFSKLEVSTIKKGHFFQIHLLRVSEKPISVSVLPAVSVFLSDISDVRRLFPSLCMIIICAG